MIKRLLDFIPLHLRFVISVYLLGIVFFAIPRFILLFQHWEQASQIPFNIILKALWMGFRFDTVISGYICAVPLLLLTLPAIPGWQNKIWARILTGYLIVLYTLAFFGCAADIPYFNYYNSRLTISVMNWTDTPDFMAKMILQDVSYYPYIGLFLIMSITFIYLLIKLHKAFFEIKLRTVNAVNALAVFRVTLISLFGFALIFLAIRGRISAKSPIRWGTAFFSNYAFANQLGLNPLYTFGHSWLDAREAENQPLHLMDSQTAINNVQKSLNIPESASYQSPIARKIEPVESPRYENVILVLMENMSAGKMGIFGNPAHLTPHLDSLATHQSYFFNNFYSSGIHTFTGIYSTLFGFPPLLSKHPMKTTESMQPFSGLAKTLSASDYQTIFFTTHDAQFDNMAGFLSYNGVQKIVSQKDYPPEEVLSTLGVPDHFMFEFSISYLEQFHQNTKPFLGIYLTGSDHGPYIIPNDIPFRPDSEEIKKQIVEYADWSIGRFMELARKQPWYDNTIFVFLADHGSYLSSTYDMALSLHHIPFIIHAPHRIDQAKVMEKLGGQVDVFPTILGMLQMPYVNNTLGINILEETRPFIYFNADENLGCLNHDYFLVLRHTGKESLYRYREKDRTNYINQLPELVKKMRTYAYSMLQTTQWLISNKLVKAQD